MQKLVMRSNQLRGGDAFALAKEVDAWGSLQGRLVLCPL